MNRTGCLNKFRFVFFTTCCYVCLTLQAQQTIHNSITKKHKRIPGTKVSIVPPAGFNRAFIFSGFQQDQTSSSIMTASFPGTYNDIESFFTKAWLYENGLQLKSIEKYIINESPASFAIAEQNIYGNIYTKHILALGSNDEIFFITGSYPNSLKNQLDLAIKNSILSVIIDFPLKENDNFSYSLNNDNSDFILLKHKNDTIEYLINDKNNEPECLLTISKHAISEPIDDRISFSLKTLNRQDIDSISSVKTAELSGYELITAPKLTNDESATAFYQLILFDDDGYYLFGGIIYNNYEKNINAIRKLSQTFKLRE